MNAFVILAPTDVLILSHAWNHDFEANDFLPSLIFLNSFEAIVSS